MIAIEVGRALLERFNQNQEEPYSAESFFEQLQWPLFYDWPDKTMYWVANSPFTQLESIAKKQNDAQARRQTLTGLKSDLNQGRLIASTTVGFAAERTLDKHGKVIKWATSSSQLMADRYVPHTGEEAYLSWIGGPCGIGVEGGYSLLVLEGDLLAFIYEGWIIYRHFLTKYPQLVGRQIETWNGQWLLHRLSSHFRPEDPLANFNPLDDTHTTVERISWWRITHALAHSDLYWNTDQLPVFVSKLGQLNDTIGYIPIELDQIRRYYQAVKTSYPQFSLQVIDRPDTPVYWLESASKVGDSCISGSLGLIALKPKAMDSYLGGIDTIPKFPVIGKNGVTFPWAICHVWLRQALNDEATWAMASDMAALLVAMRGRARQSDKLIDEWIGLIPRLPHGLSDWMTQLAKQLSGLFTENEQAKISSFIEQQQQWSGVFRWYFLTLLRFEVVLRLL